MRLSIHGFSQEVASGMVDEVTSKYGKTKTIRIDATDLLILRWFTDFYPSMNKKIIDGKEYGWIKRSKVINDLPILGISENSVSDRLRKLVHFNLLDYKLVKENGTFCYYTHGSSFPQLVESFPQNDGEGYRFKPTPPIGSNQHPLSVQTNTKDSYIKNIYNKHTNEKLSKCSKCGGKLFFNHQLGCYECSNCLEKFPK